LEGEIVSKAAMDVPTNKLREELVPLLDKYVKKAFRKPKAKFNIHLQEGGAL